MRVRLGLIGAVALATAACDRGGSTVNAPAATRETPAQPAPAGSIARTGAYVLTASGVADIRVGMDVAEIEALGRDVTITQPPLDEGSTCRYARIEGLSGLMAMLDGNKLVRIEVGEDAAGSETVQWRTAEGSGTGTTETDLRRLYGDRLTIEPHKYTGPQGHYAIVHDAGDPYGIIFETDGTRVLNWRVGQWDQVQWVEGCA